MQFAARLVEFRAGVVVACSLSVLLGLAPLAGGSGVPAIEFAPAQTVLATEGGIQDIVLADLDLDQDLDLVALAALHPPGAEGFALVHVVRNEGGSFTVSTTQAGPFFKLENFVHHLRVGDVTGDDLPDIAFIGSTTPLHLMLNLGDAAFGAPLDTGVTVSLGHLVGLLGIGDLNGDDFADVAVGLPGLAGISDGIGGIAVQEFANDFNPLTLSVLDLTGDALDDIAFGFRTHVNNGDGTFSLVGTIPAGGALDCAFADFDGDRAPDVACARFFADSVGVALNVGGGNFSTAEQHPVADCPIQIGSGNVNGDGIEDLLVTHARCPVEDNTDFVSVMTGRGDGGFDAPSLLFASSGSALAVGDLDGDGLDDLVLASGIAFFGPDGIDVLLNRTALPCPGDLDLDGVVGPADLALLLGDWGPNPVCAADLDGDGSVGAADLSLLLGAWGPCA